MQGFKRHFLRKKELREILKAFSERLRLSIEDLSLSLKKAEVVETSKSRIILIEGKPRILSVNGELYPTLLFTEVLDRIAKVVVDMGAVPHVCNGADVMAPGVVEVDGDFEEGDIVVVVDERNKVPLSIGKALKSSEQIRGAKKGKVVQNIHYVGDSIWKLSKTL